MSAADDDDLVGIGTFATAARLSVTALRRYDEQGVLVPAEVDPWSRYRRYRWDQLGDALTLTALRSAGVPLARVREHLRDGVPLHDVLRGEQARVEREAADLRRASAVLEALARVDRL